MVKANKGGKNGRAEEEGVEIPDDVLIDESTLHTLGYALRPMRKSESFLVACEQELIGLSQFRN